MSAAQPNPMPWPSFENMGRELSSYFPSSEGRVQIKSWLESPVSAAVKLDGTNVGVGVVVNSAANAAETETEDEEEKKKVAEGGDESFMLVGRNMKIEGTSYQKADVSRLRDEYPAKVGALRSALQQYCTAHITDFMVYGELMVNGTKHDYAANDGGIFKQWLAFGVCFRVKAAVYELGSTADELRQRGQLLARHSSDSGVIVISLNDTMVDLFTSVGIPNVCTGYRPVSLSAADWVADHEGKAVATFPNMYSLFDSPWIARYFLDGPQPLGEGLVVSSAHDGAMFKLKHGGEDQGRVADKVEGMIESLKDGPVSGLSTEQFLPLLEKLLVILRTAEPERADGQTPRKVKVPKVKESVEDVEAKAAWESTLTKEDDLEVQFEAALKNSGSFPKYSAEVKALTERLRAQVEGDLVKDYNAPPEAAKSRATKYVMTQLSSLLRKWSKLAKTLPKA